MVKDISPLHKKKFNSVLFRSNGSIDLLSNRSDLPIEFLEDLNKALCYYKKDNLGKAIASYELLMAKYKCLPMEDHDILSSAYSELGLVDLDTGNYDKAIKRNNSAINLLRRSYLDFLGEFEGLEDKIENYDSLIKQRRERLIIAYFQISCSYFSMEKLGDNYHKGIKYNDAGLTLIDFDECKSPFVISLAADNCINTADKLKIFSDLSMKRKRESLYEHALVYLKILYNNCSNDEVHCILENINSTERKLLEEKLSYNAA